MVPLLTERSRTVLTMAEDEARKLNHGYLNPVHILLGLIRENTGGIASYVLNDWGVKLSKAQLEVRKLIKPDPETVPAGQPLHATPQTQKVIDCASKEAQDLNDERIGTEHLLLGLLRQDDSIAIQVLMNLGVDPKNVRQEVMEFMASKNEVGVGAVLSADEAGARSQMSFRYGIIGFGGREVRVGIELMACFINSIEGSRLNEDKFAENIIVWQKKREDKAKKKTRRRSAQRKKE